MIRLPFAAFLGVLCAGTLTAADPSAYVVPVVSAKVRERVFTTTLALRNDGREDATCEASYAVPNDPNGGTLRTTYSVPAGGRPRVEEDLLMEVGAVGTMRLLCSAPLSIAARVQSSADGGMTFDEGRTYAAFSEAASFRRLRTLTPHSDLLVAEVAGRAVTFEAIVMDDAGAMIGRKTYEVPPFAQQIVNLSKIREGTLVPKVELRIVGDGGGALVVGEETDDPALRTMVVRMAPESRRAYEQHQARQAAAATAAANTGPSITQQLMISPFKAAPFHEPITGLVLMRDRWYDPRTGTFLTPDPEGYADSPNLYAFGKGDPVNNSDPTGRMVSFNGEDPWGDFFLFRDSLHNPAAAALLTLQGDAKRGYVLGLRPGVTKTQFLATAVPDPPTYLSDLTAQGIPLPKDRRTVEEKVFDLMSSMHITEFQTGDSLTRLSSWPFTWIPRMGTFQEKTIRYGGAITLEPSETPSGNTAIAVNPVEINKGSAWMATNAYGIAFDPQIATMHELGHALAYHDQNIPCFQMWSVYLENQIRARRGERTFRTTEFPLVRDPKTLICP